MFVRGQMLCLFVTYTLASIDLGQQSSQLSAHQQQLINDREQNSVNNQDSLQQERIDAIKQDILAKLGLSRVPDVSGFNITAAEKRHLLRMYRRSLEEIHGKTHVLFVEEPQQARNFYSFTATPQSDASTTNDGRREAAGSIATTHQLYFNLDIPEPDDTRKETVVTSATLKLYKYRTDLSTNHSASIDDSLDDLLTITVCQKVEEIAGNEVKLGCRLIDTKVVATRDSGWIDFNVAEMVSEWIRDPTTNFGLKVTILRATQPTVADDRGFVFGSESTTQPPQQDTPGDHHTQPAHRIRHSHDNLPLLNVIAQERLIVPSSQRIKRSLTEERQNCSIADLHTGCCRYSIWINFTAIGWNNFIVAPEGYLAYYCYGQCPLRNTITHTNYAYIRSTLHRSHRNRIPGPMCSATKSSPLSIAQRSADGRWVVSLLDDMIVQTCKCV